MDLLNNETFKTLKSKIKKGLTRWLHLAPPCKTFSRARRRDRLARVRKLRSVQHPQASNHIRNWWQRRTNWHRDPPNHVCCRKFGEPSHIFDLVVQASGTFEEHSQGDLKNLKTFVDASFGLALPLEEIPLPEHLQDNLSSHRVRQKLSSLHTTNPCKRQRRSSRYWKYSRERSYWRASGRFEVCHQSVGFGHRKLEDTAFEVEIGELTRCCKIARSGGSSMYKYQALLRMAWPNHYKVNNSWDIGKCWTYDLEISLEKGRRLPA